MMSCLDAPVPQGHVADMKVLQVSGGLLVSAILAREGWPEGQVFPTHSSSVLYKPSHCRPVTSTIKGNCTLRLSGS